MKMRMSRRDFLKSTAGAGLTLAAPYARARGANDDIRVAVVGIRSQGRNHINWFRNIPGVRVVAVCDADSSFLDREIKAFAERNEKVDTYQDYRKLLDDKNIDTVITATPNHWHALVTVWGCPPSRPNRSDRFYTPTCSGWMRSAKKAARKSSKSSRR